MSSPTFDPIWEQKYSQGHAQHYPWDVVVSFVFRNYPRWKARDEVSILEVGCGTAANLWFAAREGFSVAGVDASVSAIARAISWFAREGLAGDLRVGDFTSLPFEDPSFDLVIDRAAITCCGHTGAQRAVSEIWRVLRRGGKLLSNLYSDRHNSCANSQLGPDGVRVNISGGSLVGAGQICFYGRAHINALFDEGWRIRILQHVELAESITEESAHCEWRVIAEKVAYDSP